MTTAAKTDKANASRARRAKPKPRAKAKPKPRRNWKPIFLLAFKECGTVTAACEKAAIARVTAYEARRDEEFADAWDQIEAETTDAMEREAYRRAVEGVEKPLVSAGRLVTTATEFSDGLMMFMLKARNPGKYRENVKVEHAGEIKHSRKHDLSKLSDKELATMEKLTAKAQA